MVGPKFNKEDFSEAAVREGVDEWTHRRGEEGTLRTFVDTKLAPRAEEGKLRTFIDTADTGDNGWSTQSAKPSSRRRRSEPLDDTMSEGVTSFESVAQCAIMHTALPLQARVDQAATIRQR